MSKMPNVNEPPSQPSMMPTGNQKIALEAFAAWRSTNGRTGVWENFGGADLSRLDLRGRDLGQIKAVGADLRGADLRKANLYAADLRGADLSRANLSGAHLGEANLYAANLSYACLAGAWHDPDMKRNVVGGGEDTPIMTILKGAQNGSGESPTKSAAANFALANLRRANLSWARLPGASLREALAYGADLEGADLSGADLRGAFLVNANLSKANLSNADLSWANLRHAKLDGVNLEGAQLCGAKLLAWGLPAPNLEQTEADEGGKADASGAPRFESCLTKDSYREWMGQEDEEEEEGKNDGR